MIDHNVDTKVSPHTDNKSQYKSTECFVTDGQIIENVENLRDVNSLHVASLRSSIEENGEDYSRMLQPVMLSSPSDEEAESLKTDLHDGVEDKILK